MSQPLEAMFQENPNKLINIEHTYGFDESSPLVPSYYYFLRGGTTWFLYGNLYNLEIILIKFIRPKPILEIDILLEIHDSTNILAQS